MSGLKLITAPTGTPISVAEAKANSRDDGNVEDSLWSIWIAAAVEEAQNYMEASILAQTWEQTEDAFPEAEILIRRPPATSIVSVKYLDAAGALQTLSGASYTLDTGTWPGWLLPAYGVDWPATQDAANAVRIQYVSGYADSAAVPADLKLWLLGATDFYYQHRGPVLPNGKAVELPQSYLMRLDPHRIFRF